MSTLFISDLHLDPNQPRVTNTFFYFLDHVVRDANTLYILGDFFESYIGDDDHNEFLESIACALTRITRAGLSVFLMPGNRDFLIGKSFANRTGIILIPDPTVITLCNQKILLMHGDSLCTDDKSHQRFRKLTRNKIIQKIFLSLPLSVRQKLAKELRDESKRYNKTKSPEIMDVNQNAVIHALKKYNASKLIHGHTHRPMISEKRIVLGAWDDDGGSYLRMSEDGNVEMIKI